eukprot:41050_1
MSVPSSNPSADANSDAITSTVCCKLCLIKGLSFEACRRSKNNFSRHLNTEHNKKPVKRKKFYYVFKSDGTPNIPPMELFANHALKTGYAKGKKAHEDAKNGGDDKKAKKQWKSELCLSETTKHLNKIKDNDVDGKKDNNNQHTQQIVHHVPNDLNRSSQSNLLDPSVLNNIPSSLHPLVDMLKQNLLKTQQLQDTLDQFTRKQIECTDVKTFVKIFGNDIYVLEFYIPHSLAGCIWFICANHRTAFNVYAPTSVLGAFNGSNKLDWCGGSVLHKSNVDWRTVRNSASIHLKTCSQSNKKIIKQSTKDKEIKAIQQQVRIVLRGLETYKGDQWYYTECIERKASGLLLADKRFAHQYSKAIKRRFMVPKILGEHKQLLNTIKPSTKQPTPFGYSTDKMTINRITYGPMVLWMIDDTAWLMINFMD